MIFFTSYASIKYVDNNTENNLFNLPLRSTLSKNHTANVALNEGAPGVIAGVSFMIRDLKTPVGGVSNHFFWNFIKTPEDDIYTEHPEHQVRLR